MAYSADKKPSGLSDASTPLGAGDEIVLSQSGSVVKAALSDVELKMFSTKTGKSWAQVTGTEVVVVRETDNSLKQVALDAIVKQKLISNDHISDSAAIADTKLATISTSGKVQNSATTAASANTESAIVARDGSGNFAAGTITATLSGNATTATALATGRTISLTGDVTATTASFNGSGNVSGAATIAANAVTTSKILDANVTTAKIADANVTAAKLATDSVETAKIKDANVTAAKLATDAVETAKIKDANVTTAKILDANVTTAKIADANVTAAKLATDSVETAKIKDANVTADKLAEAAVTGAAGGGKLAASAIHSQTAKTSPVAADEYLLWDSADSTLKKVVHSNVVPAGTVVSTAFFASNAASWTGNGTAYTSGPPAWASATEVGTLSVTPQSASNYLLITAMMPASVSSTVSVLAALYAGTDTTNSVVAVNINSIYSWKDSACVMLKVSPASTSEQTVRVKASFNCPASYNGNYGPVTLLVQEIKG